MKRLLCLSVLALFACAAFSQGEAINRVTKKVDGDGKPVTRANGDQVYIIEEDPETTIPTFEMTRPELVKQIAVLDAMSRLLPIEREIAGLSDDSVRQDEIDAELPRIIAHKAKLQVALGLLDLAPAPLGP